jgi:hypothetical protein
MGGDQSAEVLRSWRGLYKAALFETDRSKIRSRIEEARSALVFRSRELFVTSPNCDDETEAIENAVYALRALENCLRLNTKDRRHAPERKSNFPLRDATPLRRAAKSREQAIRFGKHPCRTRGRCLTRTTSSPASHRIKPGAHSLKVETARRRSHVFRRCWGCSLFWQRQSYCRRW